MDTDAAKELKELREQNSRLKRLWPRLSWKRTPCGRWPRENSEPGCQAPRRGHAQGHIEHVGAVGVQGRWAGPLHSPPPPCRAAPCRSRCGDAGLAALLRHQTSV